MPEKHQLRVVDSVIGRMRAKLALGVCAIVADRDAIFGRMRMF
jgi:hypothetical protein